MAKGLNPVIVGAGEAVTLNVMLLTAAPPGVTTVIGPEVAPSGTVASISVGEWTLKSAGTPLNRTSVAPVKLVPVRTTVAPTGAPPDDTAVMVGAPAAVTVKLPPDVITPPALITVIGPVVAPCGTVACNNVELRAKKENVGVPLNNTALAAPTLLPVMKTVEPITPELGAKPLIVGAPGVAGVKLLPLVATPPGVMTVIGPAVAAKGTLNRNCVGDTTVTLNEEIGVPLSNTVVLFGTKLVPKTTRVVFVVVDSGTKFVIVGAAAGLTVKFEALVAEPDDVMTVIGPGVAVPGTVAVMVVAELVVKLLARMPLKSTAVTPTKLVPVMITCWPPAELAGTKPVTVGAPAALMVKSVLLVAAPLLVTTLIGPVVALKGMLVTLIWVRDSVVKLKACTPLKNTPVTPTKFVPVITTVPPEEPLVGVKPVIVGAAAALMVRGVLLVPTPPGVMTVTGPVLAPAGTVAVICRSELTVKPLNWAAGTPLNRTAVAPLNPLPLMMTCPPTATVPGVTDETVGATGTGTVKLLLLVAVPLGVATVMGPVVTPDRRKTSSRVESKKVTFVIS